MSFVGKYLTYESFYPTLSNHFVGPLDLLVSATEIEIAGDDSLTNQPTNVGSQTDVTASQIKLTLNDGTSGVFFDVPDVGGFNGWVFSDTRDNLPAFTNVSLNSSSTLSVPASMISFTADRILVNVDNLPYVNGQFFLLDVEFQQATAPLGSWTADKASTQLTASVYQFFTQKIPSSDGFAFLIDSDANSADLNDPYYAQFNTENRFINFANNLGSFGEGRASFQSKYGPLTFEQAVRTAFEEIIGSQAVTQNGGNPEASIQFFLAAKGYYETIANERVVPSGVDVGQATKVVAVGSILNEAIKGGVGKYADALGAFANEIQTMGTSDEFGTSLFA